ncbi:hypothetical protein K474DRAFT_1699152 [Panus rudis PR-1116 ss-1]|nr:hypothetical protein K474DRAFT_1699152 [Panus rudis PR-1116 ss-1]
MVCTNSKLQNIGVRPNNHILNADIVSQAVLHQEQLSKLGSQLTRAQGKLAHAQSDILKLRRKAIISESELACARSERDLLAATVKQLQQELSERATTIQESQCNIQDDAKRLEDTITDMQSRLSDKNEEIAKLDADCRSRLLAKDEELVTLNADWLSRIHSKDENIRRLTSKYEERLLAKEREFADLVAENKHLYNSKDSTQSDAASLQARCDALDTELSQVREKHKILLYQARSKLLAIQNDRRALDTKQVTTIRCLFLSVLVLWRFSHHLGAKLARTMKANQAANARWKYVAEQKVQNGRDRLRAVAECLDMEEQLERETDRNLEQATAAARWHGEYYFSLKAREEAARKFREYQRHATARFSSTTSKLLSGLLVLWRFNLILSCDLIDAKATIRGLEIAAQDAPPPSLAIEANFGDLDDPNKYEHISAEDFVCLPRVEAVAVYVNLCRKYNQVQGDYLRFLESCAQASSTKDEHVQATKADLAQGQELRSQLELSFQELQTTHSELSARHDVTLGSLEEARSKLQMSEKTVSNATKELKIYQDRISAAEDELRKTRQQLSIARGEARDTNAQRQQLQNELSASQQRVQTINDGLYAKSRQYEEASDKLRRAEANVMNLQNLLGQCQSRMSKLEVQLRVAQAGSQHSPVLNKTIDELRVKCAAAEQQSSRLSEQLRHVQAQTQILQARFTNADRRTSDAVTHADASQSKLKQIQGQLVTLEDQNRTKEAELRRLEEQLRTSETCSTTLGDKVRDTEIHRSKLEAAVQRLKGELQDSRSSAIQLNDRLRDADIQLETFKSTIDVLSQDLSDARSAQKSFALTLATVYMSARHALKQANQDMLELKSRHSKRREEFAARVYRIQNTITKLESLDRWYLDALFKSLQPPSTPDATPSRLSFFPKILNMVTGRQRSFTSEPSPNAVATSTPHSPRLATPFNLRPQVTPAEMKAKGLGKPISGGVLLGVGPEDESLENFARRRKTRTRSVVGRPEEVQVQSSEPESLAVAPTVPGSLTPSHSGTLTLRRSASVIDIASVLPDDDVDVFRPSMRGTPVPPEELQKFEAGNRKNLGQARTDLDVADNSFGLNAGFASSSLRMPTAAGTPAR